MGGPASAIVSEIYSYMQSLIETTAITTADQPPKVWQRHVDDVFSITRKAYLQEQVRVTRPHQQFASPNTIH